MSNHPNRGAGHPARNPAPAEVRAAREAAGLTQAQAAALVHATPRNWQQWEQDEGANVRRMHPGLWELFRLKAGLPSRIEQEERGMMAAQTNKEKEMNWMNKTLIARNLRGVQVGDTLRVERGQVFKGGERASFDLTARVAPDGEYVVREKCGAAPGDVGYYA